MASHLRDDRIRRAVDLVLGRLRRDHVAESFGTVRLSRVTRFTHERRRRARNDRSVDAGDRRHESRVARAALKVRVAVHRRQRDDVELWQLRGERQRDGVVDSGIGVDQDGSGHEP